MSLNTPIEKSPNHTDFVSVDPQSETTFKEKYHRAVRGMDHVLLTSKALGAVADLCLSVANAAMPKTSGIDEVNAEGLCCLLNLIRDRLETLCNDGVQ